MYCGGQGTTQADTPFRRVAEKAMGFHFRLTGNGSEQTRKGIYSRKTGRFLGWTHGFVVGDGGPYIRCLKTDMSPDILPVPGARPGRYFSAYQDSENTVKVYWQIRNVSDKPNPPRGAKYSDPRNRRGGEGYADYPTDSVFFDPDEVCVSLDGPRGKTRLPVTDLTLGQMVQSMGPVEEGVLRCFLKGVRQHGYLKGGAQERWWQRTGWGQEQWWGGGGKVGGRWSQQPQPQQGQQGWNQWQREGNGWVLQHRARV